MRRLIVVLGLLVPMIAVSQVDSIDLREGFVIEEFADVPNARSMVLGDGGTIFVGNRKGGSVFAVIDRDGDHRAIIEIASGLVMPNGVAFHRGDLYVAEMTRILRFEDIESRLLAWSSETDSLAEVLRPTTIKELPGEAHHGWRYIGFGPDELLYVSIGAPCNVCLREGFGLIARMAADGSRYEVFAEGVRNNVGFTWHPKTDVFWFTDNGRDNLGDDVPPGELNSAPKAGLHFGFPYCHGGSILDPEFGKGKNCADFVAPKRRLGAHVAPLGLLFYTGNMFPKEYRNQILIAEHGSWNRSEKVGYRITHVSLNDDGVVTNYEVFAKGWLRGEKVTGRPVDLLQMTDGSVLVSDDLSGKIYRISYAN